MQKILGVLALLIAICLVTAIGNPNFMQPYNLENQIHSASMYGVMSLGAALVIIGGGIDLSIGAVVCLSGCLLPFLLARDWSAPGALAAVLGLSLALGLLHGVTIVYGRLQPFVVTLCGMLIYRGIARWFTLDISIGFGERFDEVGWLVQRLEGTQRILGMRLPVTALILFVLVGLAIVALNQTVFGRYLQAVGRNEQAARYSGINTGWVTILSYTISGLTAGLAGILFALEATSVQATNQGMAYEFWAIAAAVLGGCSLRGGEGSVLGVAIGAAILQLLYNSLTLLNVPNQLLEVAIGLVILAGVGVDETIRRIAARRRAG